MSSDARASRRCSCNGIPGDYYSRTWPCSNEGRGREGTEEMRPDFIPVVREYVYESKRTRERGEMRELREREEDGLCELSNELDTRQE